MDSQLVGRALLAGTMAAASIGAMASPFMRSPAVMAGPGALAPSWSTVAAGRPSLGDQCNATTVQRQVVVAAPGLLKWPLCAGD